MCSVSYKIWGNWKSGLKKNYLQQMMRTNATKTWKQDLSDAAGPPVESSTVHWNCIRNRWKGVKKSGKQREKAEVCKITQEPDCRSDLTGLMEWWIQIWNQQRSSREVQQGVSTDICKARWRLDGGLKLSVSSDRIYEHRLKHHVITCSPWQCSQKVYRLFFCLHIVCPFTFAHVSINAFTYFPVF